MSAAPVETQPDRRIRRPIVVLLSRFPLITETFILREINELERQGQPVLLVPMIREKPEVVHEEAERWIGEALYTPFISGPILLACLRALVRRPATFLSLLWWILRGSLFHPRILVRSLLLFPKSIYLAELLSREEVRHLHAHFATHPTTMARIISAFTGFTYSFTVHAHDIFVDRSLLREKLRDATLVRSISHFNKVFLENLFPREVADKIEVVHVGIEPERYGFSKPFDDSAKPPHILSIAALKPYKGLTVLVEALRTLRDRGIDFSAEIIGAGPLRSQIEHSITASELDDRLLLRGALPQHEVARALADSDIFALPSIIASDGQMEGIPVALMEAMASGKAVVATNLSGIPELIEHEINGFLVDPASPTQLAGALEKLILDRQLRERLGARGRDKVMREFALPSVTGSLIRLFDRHSPPLPETDLKTIRSLSDAHPESAWGVRKIHRRRDSSVFEMVEARPAGMRDVILKEQRSRDGESRPPGERAADEFNLLHRLSDEWSARGFGPRDPVPAPLHLDSERAAVAMERARGHSLERILREARKDRAQEDTLRRAVRCAGEWLRRLHQLDRSDGREIVAAILERSLSDLKSPAGAILPEARERRVRKRLLEIREILAGSDAIAVLHHGDFWPGNLFFDGTAVEVIDLEGAGVSVPSEDIAWFLLHVEMYLAFRKEDLMQPVWDAFFEGYGGTPDPIELELCRISCTLRLLAKDDSHLTMVRRILRRLILRRELAR
jgi:colanic acid/amylovoran biosynthesis glycosyltransferase